MAELSPNAGLREILKSIQRAMAPCPFRRFLKVIHCAVRHVLDDPSSGRGMHSINHRELNFAAADAETDQVRLMIHLLGYEKAAGGDFSSYSQGDSDMVMVDVSSSRPALVAFCELTIEMVSTIECPGVEKLLNAELTTEVLCAHLAYNYHVRLELFTLRTSFETIEVTEEDIYAAIECVDLLISRLNLTPPGSEALNIWTFTKTVTASYISSRGSQEGFREVRDLFQQASQVFINEMTSRYPRPCIVIMLHVHNVCVLAANTQEGSRMHEEVITRFMNTRDGLPSDLMSLQYQAYCDRLLDSMMTSCNRQMTLGELDEFTKTAAWLTRNFIYHVKSSGLRYEGEAPLKSDDSNLVCDDKYQTLQGLSAKEERLVSDGAFQSPSATAGNQLSVYKTPVKFPQTFQIETGSESRMVGSSDEFLDESKPRNGLSIVEEKPLDEAMAAKDVAVDLNQIEVSHRQCEVELGLLYGELAALYDSLNPTCDEPAVTRLLREAIASKKDEVKSLESELARINDIEKDLSSDFVHPAQPRFQPRLESLSLDTVASLLQATVKDITDSPNLAKMMLDLANSASDTNVETICLQMGIECKRDERGIRDREVLIEKLRSTIEQHEDLK